jgi:transcriptional regulator with XRE-family HTH domain
LTDSPTVYGRQIRRHLTARGWSQLELSRQTGLGPQAINKMVRGRTSPRTSSLELIAKALGVPLVALLTEDEPATPKGA